MKENQLNWNALLWTKIRNPNIINFLYLKAHIWFSLLGRCTFDGMEHIANKYAVSKDREKTKLNIST